PIIIFIIIAVTRYQFPPVLRKTCYVAPRNLPSTGFFPFLETLMCNSDSSCHNTSQLAYLKQPQRNKSKEHMSVASAFFSLLLKPNEVAYLRTAQETLKFISILLNHQNITVRDVQEALKQTNLTIEELNKFAMLLGTKNVNDLIQKLNKLLNVQKCFEQETSPELIAHCAVEMVKSISGFLMHLPALKNETSILSMIPVIVNKTVTEIINTNFTSNPQKAVTGALNTILANVKMTLQQNNLSSPEILNELKVLESLVKLAANPEPLKYLNIPMNEFNAGSAELKIILWYLKRLENVTSSSSVSHLFYPVFRVTQMQVALALAQMDLNQFIGQQISNLTKSLQYPVDADGASKIGNTTIEILEHVIKFVVANLEAQNIPDYFWFYLVHSAFLHNCKNIYHINNTIIILYIYQNVAVFIYYHTLCCFKNICVCITAVIISISLYFPVAPFCTGMYLDMVNTTGGAIAWAFLKPMLMGKILYTPDTPQTRAIMTKANSTLQQLADLRHYSQDWIKSSNYIVKSSEMLTQTLPLLQNSLGNSFVKNFIEMQTVIYPILSTLPFSDLRIKMHPNMTVMLEKNTDLLRQITTLSTLMVDLSSCITFDRYQGYDTEEELNTEAQDLAKDRNLYASVIFKLPKDSRKRRSASNTTTLPPKVRYTIRMHMDNVMRTDRVREPFFTKDTHISAGQTLRYNRGFIYLQESIDRAIIEIQANKTVTDTAVQIQPFPYPCHHRDEYLEAISFVFPLLLMIAWVLFVADFVKKLVHEREMKLHEYMKMMGVNPLSHFFAWFLESAFYLVITIFFLTLVLKYGNILPHSNGFLLFLYLCDYGLSILAFSFLISTLFDKTYIAALSGSLLYVLAFFPFIIVLGLFSPTAFSYASQYVSRYEAQGEGIQWSNSYTSPIAGDMASFGWLCWLMLIDTFLYLIIGAYIRCVFPGKSGMPSPWYFPFTASFWTDLCGCKKSKSKGRGLFITNIMQTQLPAFPDTLFSTTGENFSDLPVGVALYGLTKMYGQQAAIKNLNVAFYEGHVTSLLGHNGAGKTTTMSILTGLFPPSSGTVEVYGRDMQTNLEDVRKELGVCMQYDVLFDHMTAKEHLLLYGQIKAPHWTKRELKEQIRTILEETGMYAHRHKRVGTLSGGMKRKLSISIAFIGGSRLVVLDEPTTGVDPCSRRSIWDIVIQHKKGRTIIMSTHHLDEAEVLSDRIAFLEGGGLKCCGSPFYLKDQLGQGYKLTLTKKTHNGETKQIDHAELKAFVQAHVPEARLKEAQGSDLVYLLPPFSSNNAASYRSLLSALDSNLDALQLGCYGISDTTLEEVFLHLTHDAAGDGDLPTISENVSDTDSINSFTGTQTVTGVKLAWQQLTAILIKRFHHSRRDWKGLISQLLLPVLFVVFAMGMGTIKSDLKHYPELELSPALYNIGPSYSFFSRNSSKLADTMLSFPGLDNASGGYVPPHKKIPSSQIVYNLTGLRVENYLVATADDYIRNRSLKYGGYDFGLPLPSNLQMDVKTVPKNRTLSKVWFNPEGHHTMPAYLSSMNNFILRANIPADKDPTQYGKFIIHPYFGVQGMLQIMVALCILAGYSITTASFAIYEVNEHHSGSKRLQHIAGVSEPFYWAVNFFYDMVIYLIPVALTVGVIAAFQVPAFTERQNLAAVTMLLVLFGFSTFPWMYLLSSVFKDAEMAFITYVYIIWLTIKLSDAFLIFPQFNFGNGLLELARMNIQVQLLSGYGIDAYKDPFSTEALGWMMISSFIQGVVFFTLRLLLNKGLILRRKPVPLVPCVEEDEDVAAEHLRVSSGAASSDVLQVNQLTKVYQHLNKKVPAVKKLSLGVPAGECFGLLGVNGAGKTTTFKMLTGDVSPTDGACGEVSNSGVNIGYCPQVDSLDDLLTGEEHLYFYSRLHGISKRDIPGLVNYLLRRLELDHYRDTISDNYSCGTRRKLSTALALVGHPQILLLDEPSSGMDPRTKRHLWKIIADEVKGKCAVVLTSHSMEECEALCGRLAIMVKGQFRCLGSLQHIKNRFGSGFTVKMYLAKASCDAEAITQFMQSRFPSTYLKERHSAMVEYHVPVAPGGVADIFGQLESSKEYLEIQHFSVSQTTLDEVRIQMWHEQQDMGKQGQTKAVWE
uniref:ABC transporter domain-containing protein n=1 Tax=Periophthalmus magnuspinnatus TaxID=409849 RepID=A0A3B4BHQ8_9GOBI